MFERDYILKAIKVFAEALARIAKEKKAQRHKAALTEIQTASQGLIGMSTEQLAVLPLSGILQLVRRDDAVQVQLAAATARLLKEHGEVLELSGGADPKPFYVKAFVLYDELDKLDSQNQTLAEHQPTIEWLMDRLEE